MHRRKRRGQAATRGYAALIDAPANPLTLTPAETPLNCESCGKLHQACLLASLPRSRTPQRHDLIRPERGLLVT